MRVLFDVQRAYHFQAAYRKLHKTGFRVWLLCCVAVLFCSTPLLSVFVTLLYKITNERKVRDMQMYVKRSKNHVKQISKCRYSGFLSSEQNLRQSFNGISHFMIVTKMT